jgi:hypothetical protein
MINGRIYKSIFNKKDADDFIGELNDITRILKQMDKKSAQNIKSFIEQITKLEFRN